MGYVLKKNLSARANYGAARSTSAIKYIVIHYTANDGDTDEGNGNYFHNNIVKASAHYFVDDDSVTQSVPDNYTAYSVGGSKYGNCAITGGGKYYGKCYNGNSLSIEICDDRRGGGIYPSAATIANAVALTKNLMKKYNVPASRVIRHFDVTGKSCPTYWCGTAVKNAKWKTEFWSKLTSSTPSESRENGAGVPFKVKVTTDLLNVRNGAGLKYKVNTTVKKGDVYTIIATSGNWGKLKSGAGWMNISEKYCKRI